MIFFMSLSQMLTPLPMIQPYINVLPSTASLPPMLVLNLVLLCFQLLTHLKSPSQWGTHNLVKSNSSKKQLSTISYLIPLPTIQIPLKIAKFYFLILSTFQGFKYPPTCLGGTMLSKLLSQPPKNHGFSFNVTSILVPFHYSNYILVLSVPAWNIALISGILPIILLFLIGLN